MRIWGWRMTEFGWLMRNARTFCTSFGEAIFRFVRRGVRWLAVCATVIAVTGSAHAKTSDINQEVAVKFAFIAFEICVRAGINGIEISEAEIAEAVISGPEFSTLKGTPNSSLSFDLERGDHFACDVTIAAGDFNPAFFRESSGVFGDDRMAELVRSCSWRTHQEPLASILQCYLGQHEYFDGSKYSFRADMAVVAGGPALLSFFPTLVFAPDGNAEIFGR